MTSEPVVNSEVLLWSIYELDGANDFVDVEAAFLRAFELAPQRLSWRTRPDLPDLKKCSKALRDAEARQPKLLVKNGPDLRRLTVEGQKWVEENFERLAANLGSDRIVQPPKTRNVSRLVSEIARSAVFEEWSTEGTVTDRKWRVADVFRCSPDSSQSVWRGRLETLRSAAYAAGRDDVLEFLESIARERAEWF